MIRKNVKVSKVQAFAERSAAIKSLFTTTITDLQQVNDEIETEVAATQEAISALESKKNNLEAIKTENETLRSKLSSFFN